MSYRPTAILVALLIVLGGVVYYVMQQPVATKSPETQYPPVITFGPDEANRIAIIGPSQTAELVKTGGNWMIGGAGDQPADNGRIQGWISQLSNLIADREITDAEDISTYGLTTPKFRLEIDLGGGKQAKLVFGDKTPDGGDYYVQVPDDPAKAKSVYLIGSYLGDDLLSALTSPPKALSTPTPAPTLAPLDLTPPAPATTPGAPPVDQIPPTPEITPSAPPADLILPTPAVTVSAVPLDLTPAVPEETPSAEPEDLTPTALESTPSAAPIDLTPSADDATPEAEPAE